MHKNNVIDTFNISCLISCNLIFIAFSPTIKEAFETLKIKKRI